MKFTQEWNNLHNSTKTLLLAGLLVQIITAINSLGYLHPDQHFQVIEFAGYKLGLTEAHFLPGEFEKQLRPSLQVYIFVIYYKLLQLINLTDPYTVTLIMRLIMGLLNFSLFNLLIYRAFQNRGTFFLNVLLVISCFSWPLPYIRVLFSSEVLGGLVFYAAVYFYQNNRGKAEHLFLPAVGFIFALAFYIRFHVGFALVGLAIWLVFVDKVTLKAAVLLIGGFVAGCAINVLLDWFYYGNWVLTPYNYFVFNIIEGGASSFGTYSAWYYVGILSGLLTAPPLSILLFILLLWGCYKKWDSVYSLTALVFIMAHFLVGHKEERFLFTVVGVLPIVAGYGIEVIQWNRLSRWIKGLMKGVVAFSLVLNAVLLLIMAFVPITQNLEFTRKLNQFFEDDQPVTVVCYQRSPFETPTARSVHRFYKQSLQRNISIEIFDDLDALYASMRSADEHTYYALTYDRIVHEKIEITASCKEVMHSSKIFSGVNGWLYRDFGVTLPDDWRLYQCK